MARKYTEHAATEHAAGGSMIAFAELGGFAGVEDHEIVAEPMKVSVNKPLTGLATEHSQRIWGERIEIHKKKLGAHMTPAGEMSAVEKRWKGVQKPLGSDRGEMSAQEPGPIGVPAKGELTPLGVLKNMVDDSSRRITRAGDWAKVALFMSGIGVAGFLLTLALIAS